MLPLLRENFEKKYSYKAKNLNLTCVCVYVCNIIIWCNKQQTTKKTGVRHWNFITIIIDDDGSGGGGGGDLVSILDNFDDKLTNYTHTHNDVKKYKKKDVCIW